MQSEISADSLRDVINFIKGNLEYLLVFAAVGAVIAYGLAKRYLAGLRVKKIKDFAESSGFLYEERPEFDFEFKDLGISLFLEKHDVSMLHALQDVSGISGGKYFDYQYAVGYGKHRFVNNCGVALFRSAGLSMPQFELSPETMAGRIDDLLAKSDIDFDQYPAFSRKYALSGPDRERITSLISPAVAAFFEQLPEGWSIQAAGDCVIAFKTGYVSAKDYPAFIKEARAIFSVFLSCTANKPAAANINTVKT